MVANQYCDGSGDVALLMVDAWALHRLRSGGARTVRAIRADSLCDDPGVNRHDPVRNTQEVRNLTCASVGMGERSAEDGLGALGSEAGHVRSDFLGCRVMVGPE